MADFEAMLCDWLDGDDTLAGQGFTAHGDVPETRPDRFITVERTGGQSDRFLDRPTVAVQVWAPTRNEAALAAELVRMRLLDMPSLDAVGSVGVESIYNFPDPDSGSPRYQLTVTGVVHN